MIPDNFVYLVAITPFAIVWLAFWLSRKDVRKEMLVMGVMWSFLSIGTGTWTPKFAYQPCMINRTNIQAYEKTSHRSRCEGANH